MNTVVTIFYIICGAWLLGLFVAYLVKKIKSKKANKKQNEENTSENQKKGGK